MNPLKELNEFGQSVWLDFIQRKLLTGGELKRMVEEDGLKGVTSNPAIFEKAIAESDDYDDVIAELGGDGSADPKAVYEAIATRDIQDAADVLKPVYDETEGSRRLRQPGSVALPGPRYRGNRGGGPAAVEHRVAGQPADQGSGHAGGGAGHRAVDRRGHQRQRHPAVRPGSLRAGGPSLSPGSGQGGRRRIGRGPHRQRGELFHLAHRQPGGRYHPEEDRGGGRDPKGAPPGPAGQGRHRQRQAHLQAIQGNHARARGGRPWPPGEPGRSGSCGPAPAPRTRTTPTFCMSTNSSARTR